MRDDIGALGERWLAALERELSGAEELRRVLHAHPNGSGTEEETSVRLALELQGIMSFHRSADMGRVGRTGPREGPSVALRAELDALPVVEGTGAPFAAVNGFMHACGHDVHQAALVAVVRAAAGLDLPFGLVALLQPREETYPSGALDMAAEGVLEKERVAHVIGAHVHPGVPVGALAVGGGFINAAADEIDIRLRGRGGHAAYPHNGSDPVAAAAHIALALPELVRRHTSPLNPAIVSIGTLQIGNGAANVLPSTAHIRATARTTDVADRARLHGAIAAAAAQIAGGFEVAAEIEVTEGEPILINDVGLADRVGDIVARLGVESTGPMRSLGADDFSYFAEIVPSVMLFVGVETEGVAGLSLHDPRFLPTDRAVRDVARALIVGYLAAADLLLWPGSVSPGGEGTGPAQGATRP